MHNACQINKYMKNRVYVSFFGTETVKNRAYGIQYSAQKQKHKTVKAQCSIYGNYGKNDAPTKSYIAYH